MKPTTYTIPVKFDIWDTQYTITDHMIIKCPCRKYERGNSQSWGLGHYTGTIPPEAWEYMQVTFDQSITETNLFENLWSNL